MALHRSQSIELGMVCKQHMSLMILPRCSIRHMGMALLQCSSFQLIVHSSRGQLLGSSNQTMILGWVRIQHRCLILADSSSMLHKER